MKKVITLAAALMVFGATASMASGLNLNWSGCIADGRVADMTFACNANTGLAFELYCSAVVPAAMSKFAATSAIVDVTVDGAALPDWWLTATGQCRANAISMSFDPTVLTGQFNCWNIWQDNPNLSVFSIQQTALPVPNHLDDSNHGANQVRLNGGAAVPAGSELVVAADGAELIISKVVILRSKTINTGACAGCATPACIVFNEAKMQQPAGIGDYTVTNAESANSNYVTWQTNPTNCPASTPARNRTWGSVKSLYR